MNSQKGSDNTNPLGPMPSLLFPMRAPSSSKGNETDGGKAVQWVGMTPLEMLENLAGTTEELETQSNPAAHLNPIVVDNIKLSSKTPDFPLNNEGNKLSGKLINSSVFEPEIQESKKRRKLLDGYCEMTPPTTLPPWDLSFILTRHPNTVATVNRLQFLAQTLEAMPAYPHLIWSYGRLREHTFNSYQGIQNFYSLTPAYALEAHEAEKNMHLDYLLDESIQKVEALIHLANKVASAEANPKPSAMPTSTTASLSPSSDQKKPYNKKNFTEYMTNWLRENWTNPYPDDEILAELARDCGTTPTVVGNWLINARTRKWRPAIVKAYDMGRPTKHLREDSINVFDGRPVRDIPQSEIIPSPPLAKAKRKSRR